MRTLVEVNGAERWLESILVCVYFYIRNLINLLSEALLGEDEKLVDRRDGALFKRPILSRRIVKKT